MKFTPQIWTPQEPETPKEEPLYLRCVKGDADPLKLIIVDKNGERVSRGNVCVIRHDGALKLLAGIDENAARRAGLRLDEEGRIKIV